MLSFATLAHAQQATHDCVLVQALDGSMDYVSDAVECGLATPPHSTFKLPHALIALATGVVENPLAPVAWDGRKQNFARWEQDHSLDSAVKWSVLWFFQRTAGSIGRERMQAQLKRLEYASDGYEGEQTSFWLDGDLVVTPLEQRAFLLRLVRNELPVAREHADAVKAASLMPVGKVTMGRGEIPFPLQWPELLSVHAKSGNGRVGDESVSWLIGYFTAGDTDYVFVSRSRAQDPLPLEAGTDLAWRIINELAP